jgi:hypothetical protein
MKLENVERPLPLTLLIVATAASLLVMILMLILLAMMQNGVVFSFENFPLFLITGRLTSPVQ